MKAMILAAGHGTRLQPYTIHTPKPLFSIAGQPLLGILIGNLQKAGCTAVIINTHHLPHKIEAFINEQNYSLPVVTRHEPQILGTGGAIKNVSDFWDDRPFMVINGDIVADLDLRAVYEFHCSHPQPVTMVLCDDPEFNSVGVDQNKWITGFYNQSTSAGLSSGSALTFTGIQVLNPEVLDYIPEKTFYNSIDAFKSLLKEGKMLRAYITEKSAWQDIGTPKRYKKTAIDKSVPAAYYRAFADPPSGRINWIRLQGDGSERKWYRLKANHRSLVMVDHGIRETDLNSEVDSFVRIGQHLYRKGLPVPKIYFSDTFSGLAFLDDLGDVNLQRTVQETRDSDAVTLVYKQVIDQLIALSQEGARGFDRSWTYQTPDYNQTLILEKECRYFIEAFVGRYLGIPIDYETYQEEFFDLSRKALQHPVMGFMHRDLQSRNIMINNNTIYVIDFQGGRIGPIQYDLASLLIDPYVELPLLIQNQLLQYSLERLSTRLAMDPTEFCACYHYCTLTRNLQILGAFGYLSKVKGKRHFEDYIPAAVRSLQTNLRNHAPKEFPGLVNLVQRIAEFLQIDRTG